MIIIENKKNDQYEFEPIGIQGTSERSSAF